MSTSFWAQLSTYCHELAPVVGPLFEAVGHTAGAVQRASKQTKALPTSATDLEVLVTSTEA